MSTRSFVPDQGLTSRYGWVGWVRGEIGAGECDGDSQREGGEVGDEEEGSQNWPPLLVVELSDSPSASFPSKDGRGRVSKITHRAWARNLRDVDPTARSSVVVEQTGGQVEVIHDTRSGEQTQRRCKARHIHGITATRRPRRGSVRTDQRTSPRAAEKRVSESIRRLERDVPVAIEVKIQLERGRGRWSSMSEPWSVNSRKRDRGLQERYQWHARSRL